MKLVPVEVASHRSSPPDATQDDYDMPTLARYQTRENSSWLRRLAGKFGTH